MSTSIKQDGSYLNGQLLVAMPNIGDPRFEKAVIFICAHDKNGAMGIMINHKLPDVKLETLLEDLDVAATIKLPHCLSTLPVLLGGPVQNSRGFLVHSNDFCRPDTIKVSDDIYVTGTIDALLALENIEIPQNILFALGYAGWEAGQLEQEVKENVWLNVPASPNLIFHDHDLVIWEEALKTISLSAGSLSTLTGHA